MDWFSWLSKTSLDPSLVYEYGVSFAHNELEEEDIVYFNHEFLQSMGICIAKHRLEILKLVKREKRSLLHKNQNPMSRLIIAIKKTKKSVSKYISMWVHREESALAIVPRRSYNSSSRWKNAMLKRNKKLMINKQTGNNNNNNNNRTLLLTNGSARIESFSSPMDYDDLKNDEKMDADYDDNDNDYWSSAIEEIRWDTMFQNLKPT